MDVETRYHLARYALSHGDLYVILDSQGTVMASETDPGLAQALLNLYNGQLTPTTIG